MVGALIALSAVAERSWLAGAPQSAAFVEILRLAIYWYWCRAAWRATLPPRAGWAGAARAALGAGLVIVVLT